LARRLGFPTANINPHHEVIPPAGIYAVRIIFNGKKFKGVCYIGNRPTFAHRKITRGLLTKHIEVYIFNFNRNIYGKYFEIQFIKRIRKERKFANPGLLIKQIKKDILLAKKVFSLHRTLPQDMPI
jgi:riboflavin kinase/FMN adenylyltransferase